LCARYQAKPIEKHLNAVKQIFRYLKGTIMSFLRELGHTREINSLNDVVVDQMHQPWRTFAALINRSLSGKTTGLNKLRFFRAQILWGMYH
ncbi:hypothetical protein Tco_1468928, partial [Tanacetum coccineum]